jgi:hypothetical protein
MRLQRLHLSSNPPATTLAISWPHSQRVSLYWEGVEEGVFVEIMAREFCKMIMRTIINILISN